MRTCQIRGTGLVLAVALWTIGGIAGLTQATAVETGPCLAPPLVQQTAVAAVDRPFGDVLTIASLNMAGQTRIADPLYAWVERRDIDVLLLQEAGPTVSEGEAFVRAMGDRLGYHVVWAPASPIADEDIQALAILSRFPMLDARAERLTYHRLRFRSRCRITLMATVSTPLGPVRVADVHLDTRINSRDRVAQLEPVAAALAAGGRAQVIGGDFNSANIGWLYSTVPVPYSQRQPAAVREALEALGFETPFGHTRPTFKLLRLPLKLDWLYVRHLQAVDFDVDDVQYSDHRGIWTRVTRAPDASGGESSGPGAATSLAHPGGVP